MLEGASQLWQDSADPAEPEDEDDTDLREKLVLFDLLRELNTDEGPPQEAAAEAGSDTGCGSVDNVPGETRELGFVEKFAPKRGFGIIKPTSGGDPVFVHWTQIYSNDKWPTLASGMVVEYTLEHQNGRPVAKHVTHPGGTLIVSEEELNKGGRLLSPFTLTGTVDWFHKAGYGFINLDTEMEWPERLRKGSQVYVSREDIVVAKGGPCVLEAGQKVEFKVFKPPGKPVAAAEVTAPGGIPIVTRREVIRRDWSQDEGFVKTKGLKRELPPDWNCSTERPAFKLLRVSEGNLPNASPHFRNLVVREEEDDEEDVEVVGERTACPGWQPSEQPALISSQRRPGRVRRFFGEGDPELVEDLSYRRPATEQTGRLSLWAPYHKESSGSSCGTQPSGTSSVDAVWEQRSTSARGPSQPSQSSLGSVACKFYAEGRCAKGQACAFSHELDLILRVREEPRESSTRKVPCRFFAAGRCRKMDSCPFAHDVTTLAAVPLEKKVPVQCEFFNIARCTRGEACPFAHGPQELHDITTLQTRQHSTAGSSCEVEHPGSSAPGQQLLEELFEQPGI